MKNIDLYGLTCFKVKLKIDKAKDVGNMKYLLLESDPNPDYYARHNFPPNEEHTRQKHFYLLVKNHINCFQDVILRNTAMVREQFGLLMHPGYMTFNNEDFLGVRLDVTDISRLVPLTEMLKELGLRFVRDKHVHPYESLVHYKKYVEYMEIEDGVFQDHNDPYRFFFKINRHLDFDHFQKGMEEIKFSCNFHLFDAFLTDMFIRNEMLDFVGVYSKHCDPTRFGELKKELKRYFEQ